MSQRFCKKCGAPLKEGFRFCKKCGAPVPQVTPVAQKTPVPQEAVPVTQKAPVPQVTPVAQKAPVQQNTNYSPMQGVVKNEQPVFTQGEVCIYCGTLNKLGTRFCAKCGKPMKQEGFHNEFAGGAQAYGQPQNTNNINKKEGTPVALIIVLVVLLVVVLGIGGFMIYTFVSENKTKSNMQTVATDNQGGSNMTDNESTDNPYADPELEPSKIPAGDDASKHTYELVKADITWSEAERLAEEKGGYLACISDQNEESEIVNYLAQFNDLKIVYIGAKRGTVGFKWMSGEPFTYYNWAEGEPNNYNSVEGFVCLYNADGSGWKWNDCPDNMYQQGGGQFLGYTGYLIEYNSETDQTSPEPNEATEEAN